MQVEEEAFKEIRFYICGVFLDKLMGQDKKNNLFGLKKKKQVKHVHSCFIKKGNYAFRQCRVLSDVLHTCSTAP